MIAVINSGRSLRNSFYYNENKVKEGVAELILAGNYPLNAEDTTEQSRLNMLQRIAGMNPNVKRPSIHISLNFAPGEHLSVEKLQQISQEYMEAIGFGAQPYLVYQHKDAAHPHVHILSLRVRPDGTTIDTFGIGKRLSRPAEQALEEKHHLVRSKDHKQDLFSLKPVDAARIAYGKVPTKKAISNILASVLDRYKYTSLPELNALLRLYNIAAERGEPGSRLHQYKGLQYRVIGADGNPVGSPVKASAFPYRATLKDLEARFLRNDVERQSYKSKLKLAIDFQMRADRVLTVEQLALQLKRQGIDVAARRNEQGYLYGITFIDHRNKVVFKGSDLGTAYSAKAISELLSAKNAAPGMTKTESQAKQNVGIPSFPTPEKQAGSLFPDTEKRSGKDVIEVLTQAEYSSNYVPAELRRTKKRRKKRSI